MKKTTNKQSIVPPSGVRGLIIIFHLIFITSSYSQTFKWGKKGGSSSNPSYIEEVYSMAVDNQNNIYCLSTVGKNNLNIDGNTKQYLGDDVSNYNDIALSSFACDGTYRWSKIIGGGYREWIPHVKTDAAGNVYIAGAFGECLNQGSVPRRIDNDYYSPSLSVVTDCKNFFIAMFNSSGTMQWIRLPEAATTNASITTIPWASDIDSNGVLHVLVAITAGQNIENGAVTSTSSNLQYHILKYNHLGNFLGSVPIAIETQNTDIRNFQFKINPYNGNYYISGSRGSNTHYFKLGPHVYGDTYSFLASFNPQGQYLWHRTETPIEPSTGSSLFKIRDFVFDSENNIYLATNMTGFNYVSYLGHNETALIGELLKIFKLNPTGENILWVSSAQKTNSAQRAGIELIGDNLYVTASESGTVNWGTQSLLVTTTNQSSEIMLARLNKNTGACQQLVKLSGTPNYPDYPNILLKDKSNDLLIGGGFGLDLAFTNQTILTTGGDTDFFIGKFSTQDCTPLELETQEKPKYNSYPNPVNDILNIEIPNLAPNTSLKIYDLQGRTVYTQDINQSQQSINLQHLANGIYTLQIYTNNQVVKTDKILKN